MASDLDKIVNADTVKNWILDQGIDLVGIATADTLILSHPPRPATALMPTAKSVVVMAVAHTLGSVYAPDIMLWTRSKMQTSRLLDETAEKLGRRLERTGFLTLPISADKPVAIFKNDPETGKKFHQTRMAAFLSFKHARLPGGEKLEKDPAQGNAAAKVECRAIGDSNKVAGLNRLSNNPLSSAKRQNCRAKALGYIGRKALIIRRLFLYLPNANLCSAGISTLPKRVAGQPVLPCL